MCVNLKTELKVIKANCNDLTTYLSLENLINSLPNLYVVDESEAELISKYRRLKPSMRTAIAEIVEVSVKDERCKC